MRTTCVALAGWTLLFLGTLAAAEDKQPDNLGQKIDSVSFADSSGKTTHLYDLKDRKAVVVVFLSFDCPVSNSYLAVLADLHKNCKEKVALLGVCVSEDEPAAVARHVRALEVPFPVFADAKQQAVKAFKAEIAPEAFLLDGEFRLRYRGRIDNGYSARLKRNYQVTRHDLRLALDELLAGKAVSVASAAPVGCPIFKAEKPTPTARSAVTFHRDVVPILQARCQSCHRAGQIGPFELTTYRQAVAWATEIKEFTQTRKMPPWKPVEGHAFQNERKMTDKEIATLAAWVDGGAPEGNAKDAPGPLRFKEGWAFGEPDLILSMQDDFQLGPTGGDVYRCIVLPTNLTEDRYVTAVEVRPGNPRIFHHAILLHDTSGRARKLEDQERQRPKKDDEPDRGPGYNSWLGMGFIPKNMFTEPPPFVGGWAPGQVPFRLPDGTGFALPKGADVVLQAHYHRNGRTEKDRTTVGLYLAKKPVERPYHGFIVPGNFVYIPEGVERHRIRGSIRIEQDCTIYDMTPHMHLIGRQIRMTMTPPDGSPSTLIAIADWDFNWQETYILREPIAIKAGTRFDVEAIYDNSARNPNNPFNPPRTIFTGLQTTNEMCLVFVGGVTDRPGHIRWRLLSSKKSDDSDEKNR